MAIDHNSQAQEMFDVVEALYQEAELTLPKQAQSSPAIAVTTHEQDETPPKIAAKPTVIQSRKARVKTSPSVPIFTRISDLYEEAEAARILAQEEAESDTNQIKEAQTNKALPDILPDDAFGASDPFLPASFDAPQEEINDATPEEAGQAIQADGLDDATEAALSEALAIDDTDNKSTQDDDFIIPATFGATDDELDILAGAIAQDAENNQDSQEKSDDNLTISEALEPAVSLDDAIEQLDAEQESALKPTDMEAAATSEADALAALDASRPQADDEMTQQLEDVRSAVVQAQSANNAPVADEPQPHQQETNLSETNLPETNTEEVISDTSDTEPDGTLSDVKPGPELVAFIGETVRDVLDEQLPTLVRGLVDEALGERQGRYGRSETPHIGLRTKPSRH